MADEIEISHGGVLSVDTDELREVAARARAASAELRLAGDELNRAAWWVSGSTADSAEIVSAWGQVCQIGDEMTRVAEGVGLMVEAYELVELRARVDALAALDPEGAAALRRDYEIRIREDPVAHQAEESLRAQAERERLEGFSGQGRWLRDPVTGVAPLAVLARGWGAATAQGHGIIPAGAHLAAAASTAGALRLLVRARSFPLVPGGPAPLRSDPRGAGAIRELPGGPLPMDFSGPAGGQDVRELPGGPLPADLAPPSSLEALASRFPEGDAQVRIETYTLSGGEREHIAYIAGTRSALAGGEQPWDMLANTELYLERRESDSYRAVVRGLEAVDVAAGEPVHLVGHSQGGMIAGWLAMASEHDVRTLVTFGSPIEPHLGPEVLSVAVRHTDDPVAALAGGGSAAGTGAPESMVISRVADPRDGPHDLLLGMHHLETYGETAALADASGDPRMGALESVLDTLRGAQSLRVTEITAARDQPHTDVPIGTGVTE